MKRIHIWFVASISLLFVVCASYTRADDILTGTVRSVLPSVVSVYTGDSSGSGFFVDGDGHVITNYHVVKDNTDVKVKVDDSEVVDAVVLGTDKYLDLALLKVDGIHKNFVAFESSDNLEVGDEVFVIGNSLNVGLSVSTGAINGIDEDLLDNGSNIFLRTDAAVNKGDSGAPLFSIAGKVVGIMVARRKNNSNGYAVPANTLMPAIDELKTFGYIKRGWLGAEVEKIDSRMAEALELHGNGGVIVKNITQESPAMDAGVAIADVITLYGNKPVSTPSQLARLVEFTAIGASVPLTIFRKGALVKIPVKIIANERDDDFSHKMADIFDMLLLPIDKDIRRAFNLPKEVKGAYIFSVEKDGVAATHGIRTGDILLSINQSKPTMDVITIARNNTGNTILMVRNLKKNKNRMVVIEGQMKKLN